MHFSKLPENHPRILAECTLGRLAKWLRLAGLDARYDRHLPNADRLARICRQEKRMLLTRTRSVIKYMGPGKALYVPFNHPLGQARLVVHELGLRRKDLRPMSRCGHCNCPLQKIPNTMLVNRVPEYVLQSQEIFNHCPECDRTYWQGSHASRWLAFMDQWFTT